ncbi:MAG: hypothetical protein ABIT20_24220 [Gemmatimonadaceae bacterium]
MHAPEAVLRAALEFRDRLDYAGVVALCDPASVESELRQWCELFAPCTEAGFRRENPDFPDAQVLDVVAYLNRRSSEQIPRHAPGIMTYAEFLALAPTDYYRRSLERDDTRLEIIRRMRARGRPVPEAALAPPTGFVYEILPAESVSDDEVIVRYRMQFDDDRRVEDPELEHERLHRMHDGTWRLVARRDLLHSRGSVVNIVDGVADLFDDGPSG